MSGRWYATLAVLALLFANNRLYLVEDRTGNWPAGAPVGKLGQPIPPDAAAVWRAGTIICVEPSQILASDQVIGIISYGYRDRAFGLDPAATVYEDVMNFTVGGANANPKAVRTAYLAWLAKHPDSFWQSTASRLTAQAVPGRSVRWRAIFRLFSNIVLVILFIRSLAWTVPILDAFGRTLSGATMTPAERAAIRRKKALTAGECPACAYDIRGLPTRVCPECAHRWTEAEARLVPRK